MPGMCGNVARGWMLKRVEDHLNDTTKRASIEARLVDPEQTGLLNIFKAEGILNDSVVQDRLMERHVRLDWLAQGGGFWPKCDNKEAVLTRMLLEAISQAKPPTSESPGEPLPIKLRWICMGDKDDDVEIRFECAINRIENPDLILVMILTPGIPYGQMQPDGRVPDAPEPIRVICDESRKDHILGDTAATGPGARPTQDDCVEYGESGIWSVPLYT